MEDLPVFIVAVEISVNQKDDINFILLNIENAFSTIIKSINLQIVQ